MKLTDMKDNDGATHRKMRVGRGIGSGKGKTAGRGVKGQKSRSGVAIKGFEGGQMPLHRRLPKRGFNNIFRLSFVEVTLARIQRAIDSGKLKAGKIDEAALVESGVIRRSRDGIRLVATGELTSKIELTVTGASAGAVAAVEKAGGTVTLLTPKEEAPRLAACRPQVHGDRPHPSLYGMGQAGARHGRLFLLRGAGLRGDDQPGAPLSPAASRFERRRLCPDRKSVV